MYRFTVSESGVGVQPFGPDFSGIFSDILRQADGQILGLEIAGSGAATLRRLSATGELDTSLELPLWNPQATGSIELDEARGLLYFGASIPDPNSLNSFLHRQARLDMATLTVDDNWPNEAEEPGVLSKLTLRGSQVFAAARLFSLNRPIGAYMSTTVPPLFADGFEPN